MMSTFGRKKRYFLMTLTPISIADMILVMTTMSRNFVSLLSNIEAMLLMRKRVVMNGQLWAIIQLVYLPEQY